MARCQSCRYIIERLEGTETWVKQGTIDVTGMSGQAECEPSPTGEHVPAKMTTIERILINEDDDAPHRVPECRWCAWPVVAEFYIGGEPVCLWHLDDALNHAARDRS